MYAFAGFVRTEMVRSFWFPSSHVFRTVKYTFVLRWIQKKSTEKYKPEVDTLSLILIQETNRFQSPFLLVPYTAKTSK